MQEDPQEERRFIEGSSNLSRDRGRQGRWAPAEGDAWSRGCREDDGHGASETARCPRTRTESWLLLQWDVTCSVDRTLRPHLSQIPKQGEEVPDAHVSDADKVCWAELEERQAQSNAGAVGSPRGQSVSGRARLGSQRR